ncbi:CRISPR-associated helicase Cas3' [Streptomyces erythrochromogenes]|uniref:CRISPR-associated helicase Cas3' n=1 Tax=Streptomyces erythrochromogenes TaxID=285574 RepID=UPI00368F16AF
MTIRKNALGPARRHLMVWAKTDRHRRGTGTTWNPLLAHALDTAAVVEVLWGVLPPGLRARLADGFGAGDEDAARRVLMFLAALHDLGKGSPCFLRQFASRQSTPRLREAADAWEQQARAAGLPLPADLRTVPHARHEHVTAVHLPRLLGCTCPGCGGAGPRHEGLHTAAALLGGHHGHIPGQDTIDRAAAAADITVWQPVYSEFVDDLAELIGLDLTDLARLIDPVRPSVLPVVAGMVICADWIASDETLFTYRSSTTATQQWWASSRAEARDAGDRLLLRPWEAKPAGFADLFPGTAARPFQAAAMAAMPASGPALVIVETDTGSGKTRLALWLAHHLAVTCGYQGLYMAMPTRASTNQTGRELREFIKHATRAGETVLALAHASADSSPLTHELLDAGRTRSQQRLDHLSDAAASTSCRSEGASESRAVLSPWYLRRCLGLIAPFATGTVDQAVLAPQGSRHWMLRMFGLACKVLIIDEAHAYELFQQGLLAALVEWLADAGASVIVLSATLPASAREALTAAWCRGLRSTMSDDGQSGPVTIVDSAGAVTHTGMAEEPPALTTEITFLPDPGGTCLADRVLAEAADGGITVILRNRVNSARQLYNAVQAGAAAHGWDPEEIILLHGRSLPRYRLPIEEQLRHLLGPSEADRTRRNPHRPDRLIVVATQVVEQSLDIDFDRIYTDLAPVDLLIQRRGRVHRHAPNDPDRAAWCSSPAMTVLVQPDPATGLPLVEPPDYANGRLTGNADSLVYAPYALLATWHALTTHQDAEGRIIMTTPTDSPHLIESVYGPPQNVPGTIGELLERTRTRWEAELASEHAQCAARSFHPYSRRQRRAPITVEGLASGQANGDGDDASTGITGLRAVSRLGDPSIEALFLYRQTDGTITYDPSGRLRADLARRTGDTPAHRAQQTDYALNTAALPAHWFHGLKALPAPSTWPTISGPALKDLHVALLDPATGTCLSGPIGLTHTPTTGFTK